MPTALTLEVNSQQVESYIHAKASTLEGSLVTKLNELNEQLAAKIRGNLSGAVLQSRTGRLLGTVGTDEARKNGTAIEAGVHAAGPEAPYGTVHEFGGTRSYMISPVTKKALAFEMGGKNVIAKSVVHPPLAKRSFFFSETTEMSGQMAVGLQETIDEVLHG